MNKWKRSRGHQSVADVADSDARRLAYERPEVVMIPVGYGDHLHGGVATGLEKQSGVALWRHLVSGPRNRGG